MMSGKIIKIIIASVGLALLGVALVLISCNKDGSSPVTPQVNGGAANFYAQETASCDKPYGAYYQEGDAEASIKICKPGDYQIEYQVESGVTYYLWVRVNKPTILHIGLYSSGQNVVNLVKMCVRQGVINLEDSAMNVSGPVRYYPTGGIAIPDAPAIFESDGSRKICMIEDGEVNVGSQVDELPAPQGSAPTGPAATPTPGPGEPTPTPIPPTPTPGPGVPTPTPIPPTPTPGTTTYDVTVSFTGDCTTGTPVAVTIDGKTANGIPGDTKQITDISSGTHSVNVTGGCGSPSANPMSVSGAATVIVTDNAAAPTTYDVTVNFAGTCTSSLTVNCTEIPSTSPCSPSSMTGTGAGGTTQIFQVTSGQAANLTQATGTGCGSAGFSPGSIVDDTTTMPVTVTDNAASAAYDITVNFTGNCRADATVSCSAGTCTYSPDPLTGTGAANSSGTVTVTDGGSATLQVTGGCNPVPDQTTFTAAGTATVTDDCGAGGVTVAGSTACWYASGVGNNCNTACGAPRGGVNTSGLSYFPAAGTATCDTILSTIVGAGGAAIQTGNNQLGCYHFTDNNRYLDNDNLTETALNAGANIACPCNK